MTPGPLRECRTWIEAVRVANRLNVREIEGE